MLEASSGWAGTYQTFWIGLGFRVHDRRLCEFGSDEFRVSTIRACRFLVAGSAMEVGFRELRLDCFQMRPAWCA